MKNNRLIAFVIIAVIVFGFIVKDRPCKNIAVSNGNVNRSKGYSNTIVAEKRCPSVCKKQKRYKYFHGSWHSNETKDVSFCSCCKK